MLNIGPVGVFFRRQRENCALSYYSDVTCTECWSDLKQNGQAQLIDVRTSAEWSYVGIPDLSGISKETLLVEWQQFPHMQVNAGFVESVSQRLSQIGIGTDAPIYTLCRSGVRSISAAVALTEAGFEQVSNVLGGFEGPPNDRGHRGSVAGWKVDDLPWRQG